MKKIIINGILVTHDSSAKRSISFEKGIITEIAEEISLDNAEVIDAQGCYILPGGVDMLTSLAYDKEGKISQEAFKQNSLSCLYGGTTTVIEKVLDDTVDTAEKFQDYVEHLKDSSYTDFSFHQNYAEDSASIDEILKGYPSYFLSTSGDNEKSDKQIMDLVLKASPLGATTFVHAESQVPITCLEKLHKLKNKVGPYAHYTSRPEYTELEAFTRISNLTRATNVTFALESISTKEVVKELYNQVNEGLPITMLTSPHYLIFNKDKYLSTSFTNEDIYKYSVNPPLREDEDAHALWKAIKSGLIHCIVSNHNGVSLKSKLEKAQGNIFNLPASFMGIPSAELRLSLLHTFGVLTNKISINKLVEITATHVTRIAGLREKGRIEAGTNADIVIFDPNKKKVVKSAELHDDCDYSPYEGMELQGFAKHVFLRGKQVIEDFELIEKENHGKLIFRKAVSVR